MKCSFALQPKCTSIIESVPALKLLLAPVPLCTLLVFTIITNWAIMKGKVPTTDYILSIFRQCLLPIHTELKSFLRQTAKWALALYFGHIVIIFQSGLKLLTVNTFNLYKVPRPKVRINLHFVVSLRNESKSVCYQKTWQYRRTFSEQTILNRKSYRLGKITWKD